VVVVLFKLNDSSREERRDCDMVVTMITVSIETPSYAQSTCASTGKR